MRKIDQSLVVPNSNADTPQRMADVFTGAAAAASVAPPRPPAEISLSSGPEELRKHLEALTPDNLETEIKRLFVDWRKTAANLKTLAQKMGPLRLSVAYRELEEFATDNPSLGHLFRGPEGILDLMDKAAKEMGGFEDGLYDGEGEFTYETGETYRGNFRLGLRHGRGTQIEANGTRYKGEWRGDRRHGRGTRIEANGTRYEGEWENALRHGRGTQIEANGTQYEGEWKKGLRHGRGTQIEANGTRYEGEWENDLRHGEGTQIWGDGSKYEGRWLTGGQAGQGTLTSNIGERILGQFWNDSLSHCTWSDCNKKWEYAGEWSQQHFDASGKWTKGQQIYSGPMIDNQPAELYVSRAQLSPANLLGVPAAETFQKTGELVEQICLGHINIDEFIQKFREIFPATSEQSQLNEQLIIDICRCTPGGLKNSDKFMKLVLEPLFEKTGILKEVKLDRIVSFEENIVGRAQKSYGSDSQKAFAGWMHLMAESAKKIMQQEPINFESLFFRLGAMRYLIARIITQRLKEPQLSLGTIRAIGITTPLVGYPPFEKYLNDLPLGQKFKVIMAKGPKGEELIATRTTVEPSGIGFRLVWEHSYPKDIRAIREMFEEWTRLILKKDYSNKPEELYADLAHWYHTSVQGTFYFNGSAAITQAMFVGLCRAKNIDPPIFIDNLDCWALSMAVEDFKEKIFVPWFKKESIELVSKYQGYDNPNKRS